MRRTMPMLRDVVRTGVAVVGMRFGLPAFCVLRLWCDPDEDDQSVAPASSTRGMPITATSFATERLRHQPRAFHRSISCVARRAMNTVVAALAADAGEAITVAMNPKSIRARWACRRS